MRATSTLATAAVLILASSVRAENGVYVPETGFRWRPAITQSLLFLGVEHGFRLGTQERPRQMLRGPFWKDYADSVKGLAGWDDGDSALANYVGHPMQGSVTGYIQVQNDPMGITEQFGIKSSYWTSRLKATAWSAAYSTQYELGPLGEAAIGNTGKIRGTKGAVDLVVTPTLGLAWMVTEDALDRHIVLPFERRVRNPWLRLLLRSGANPTRSFANMLRWRVPWHRDTREGVGF